MACSRASSRERTGAPGGAGVEHLHHQTALPGHLDRELSSVHDGGEGIGGERALGGGRQGEDLRPQVQEAGGGQPGLVLGNLCPALQHLGAASLQVLGEGAVVDQGGDLGEVGLHGLIGIAADPAGALGLPGEEGLGPGGVFQSGPAGEELDLELRHLSREGGGRLGEPLQGSPLLLGAAPRLDDRAGEGGGVVPGPGQEGGGLLQLHIAVGQLAQGHLGGGGLAVDLGAKGAEHGGRGGIDHLLEIRVQLVEPRGQLGEGVEAAVGQGLPVGGRLPVPLYCQPYRHGEGSRQIAHPPDQGPAAHMFFAHIVTPHFSGAYRPDGDTPRCFSGSVWAAGERIMRTYRWELFPPP